MKTAICCIAKMENFYMREYVEWYKERGFSNIILYDNNDIDGEKFEEVIKDYIEDGYVILRNFRGKKKCQIEAYQDCYNNYGNVYDWIGFFDADEYFEMDNGKVAEDFFNEDIFGDAQAIRVCWKNFNDSGILYINDNYSIRRFTETVNENDICNRTSKVFIRGGQNIHFYEKPGGEHGQYLNILTRDCHGDLHNNDSFVLKNRIWDNGWLQHYRFKTLEEYCTLKLKRLYPNVDKETAQRWLTKGDFFSYNKWTQEKEDLFNQLIFVNKEVICCIFNYKKDKNALQWFNRCKEYYKTYILDSNYVDNGGEIPQEFKDDRIVLCRNIFCGGLTLVAYKILKRENGRWLMIINSDVECDNENFSKLLSSVNEVTGRNDIGVWEPSAKRGSMCDGSTSMLYSNLRLFNQGTNTMREVKSGEGWFEFVREDICDDIIPHLNLTDNKYGWGINDCFNRIARKKGLKVVIDDRVEMYHPAGTGYGYREAAKEYERLKSRFTELGIEEKNNRNMKTLICCIGKNENRYIREYVDHYKNIGITNICLYDNNDVDGERFEDVIGEEIKSGFVIYNDWRGRKLCQMQSYQDCYDRFGNDYDWVFFIDCGDEYLELKRAKNVEEFLSMPQYENFDLIHLNLMTFGDSDVVDYEDGLLHERFKTPIPWDTPIAYDFPENYHISSIVRGGLGNRVLWKCTPHTPNPCNLRCCNEQGFTIPDPTSPFVKYSYEVAWFNHYTSKTAREYAWKMKRGFPDHICDGPRIKNLVETRFFRTNKITPEKVEIFKEELGMDFSYLLPQKEFTGEKRKDVQIFNMCFSKKDYGFKEDSVITPIQLGAANGTDVCKLKDNTGDNISGANFFYIENTGIYWIWKNVKDAKYKGQFQYRRVMDGVDETMDFEDIFSKYDVITCEPFNHPANSKPTKENNNTCIPATTVEGGYAFSNCLSDLLIMEKVVKEMYPDYKNDWDKYIKNGPNLYYSSGFVMRSEDYDRYCNFLFNCFNGWLGKTGIQNQLDLYYHVGFNMGAGRYIRYDDINDVPKGAVKWQTELGGFLGERLWTLWLLHNFKEERIYKVPYIKQEEGMYT